MFHLYGRIKGFRPKSIKLLKTRPTLTVFQFFFFFKFVNVKHVSDVYGHDQQGSFCVSRIDQEASRFSYESEVFEL